MIDWWRLSRTFPLPRGRSPLSNHAELLSPQDVNDFRTVACIFGRGFYLVTQLNTSVKLRANSTHVTLCAWSARDGQ